MIDGVKELNIRDAVGDSESPPTIKGDFSGICRMGRRRHYEQLGDTSRHGDTGLFKSQARRRITRPKRCSPLVEEALPRISYSEQIGTSCALCSSIQRTIGTCFQHLWPHSGAATQSTEAHIAEQHSFPSWTCVAAQDTLGNIRCNCFRCFIKMIGKTLKYL